MRDLYLGANLDVLAGTLLAEYVTLSLDYSQDDGGSSRAGSHEEAIVVRHDGRLVGHDTIGVDFPRGLALDLSDCISNMKIKTRPRDVVARFTDGVTEAENGDSRQHGVERRWDIIVQNRTRTSEQIRDAIIHDVMSCIGGSRIWDDMTVLVIKRLESGGEAGKSK